MCWTLSVLLRPSRKRSECSKQACSRMELHKDLPAAHEEWLMVGCIDCFFRATSLRLSAQDLWSVFLRGAGCFELPMELMSARAYLPSTKKSMSAVLRYMTLRDLSELCEDQAQ
ncbi:hypothetical protein HBI56_117010 [Parastagonospora nodorum]|uniref:Uncharacterized protein n=1 Tax=Phaeosphaeria nodorum (strain SN15 / ATCC MYA-4574 / FGSC 10173) TaxID=321614 RepID=A0A7U2I3T6_PHANO|nr:hypothetical protein HBH56_199930 [Parastagonospora nodorum]QRD00739.1 hypothetical protein JI435_438570 [Parastagonospora nodorum SN15]KAH3925884.1 hypothetical protein HBH54_176370 [Parastagonospora nodorum]KAH3953019.1 hypothetical protein HBH53_037750 [Parastagonospora nodorum]KAH4068256.1 hypothetical protein HBH50_124580 [Parastagonospora nodorum]